MPATEPTKKVCIVCGTDVSGKPRVKNAAGQYVCKGACEAKIKSSQGGSDDMMSKLLDASPAVKGKPCESCGAPLKQGAVVCTNCGTNVETGKKLKTAVVKEAAPKKPNAVPRMAVFDGPSFGTLVMLLSLVLCGSLSLVFVSPMLMAIGGILIALAHMVGSVWTLIDAFKNGDGLKAFLLLPIYGLFMNPMKWSRAIYTASVIGGIMLIIVALIFQDEINAGT